MKPSFLRGLVPSMGAGASLVAAVGIAAVLLGGLLAFDGWPGRTGDARGDTVVLSGESPLRARTDRGRGGAAAIVAPRRVAPPRLLTPGRRAAGPTARRRAVAPAAPQATAPSGGNGPAPAPQRAAPPAAAPATPTRSSPPPAPGVPPLPQLPPVPATPVSDVVDTAQQALPPLPAPTQPVVDVVNDVLDDTATIVDDVIP